MSIFDSYMSGELKGEYILTESDIALLQAPVDIPELLSVQERMELETDLATLGGLRKAEVDLAEYLELRDSLTIEAKEVWNLRLQTYFADLPLEMRKDKKGLLEKIKSGSQKLYEKIMKLIQKIINGFVLFFTGRESTLIKKVQLAEEINSFDPSTEFKLTSNMRMLSVDEGRDFVKANTVIEAFGNSDVVKDVYDIIVKESPLEALNQIFTGNILDNSFPSVVRNGNGRFCALHKDADQKYYFNWDPVRKEGKVNLEFSKKLSNEKHTVYPLSDIQQILRAAHDTSVAIRDIDVGALEGSIAAAKTIGGDDMEKSARFTYAVIMHLTNYYMSLAQHAEVLCSACLHAGKNIEKKEGK
ncbi:hypothetical protein CZP2022_4 [Vibrio phage C-ZP2022]|nr:hypothetical protein CZP2022_4 [Vibrio phage C-ZP2022]